jgi:hypothetical protein
MGCVQIDGGSVEVSWVIHANGRGITDCSCAMAQGEDVGIAKVRIDLLGKGMGIEGATPCAGRAQCEFSCQRSTGATPFDIPETKPGQTYGVKLVAVDVNGQDIPTITGPDRVYRSIVRGQPTEVEAFLLQARCSDQCGGTNNSGVCARP